MVGSSERVTNTFVDKVLAEVNKRNRISINLPSISESGLNFTSQLYKDFELLLIKPILNFMNAK